MCWFYVGFCILLTLFITWLSSYIAAIILSKWYPIKPKDKEK